MEKVEKAAPKKEEPVAVPNHTEKIKSQVLAKIGKPPRLDRVEVSRHHNGNYRVNIWEQPEPNKNIAVTIGPRIGPSYYLTVSDTGEIIRQQPAADQIVLFGLNLPSLVILGLTAHPVRCDSIEPKAPRNDETGLHASSGKTSGSASKTPGRHDADGR